MSFDERLFGWLYHGLKRRRYALPTPDPEAAFLAPAASRLELLASALAGGAVILRPAEDHGYICGNRLLLPEYIALGGEHAANQLGFVFRVAYSVALGKMKLVRDGLPEGSFPIQVASALTIPTVLSTLEREFPRVLDMLPQILGPRIEAFQRLRRLASRRAGEQPVTQAYLVELVGKQAEASHRELLTLATSLFPLFGVLGPAPSDALESSPCPENEGAPPAAGGSEYLAPRRDQLQVKQTRGSEENENPLVHSFEKVHTLEDYQGGAKRHDGEDELKEHLAALEELDLRQVIRSPERTKGVLKLDGLFEGAAGDLVAERPQDPRPCLRYDEWHAGQRKYRKGWCTVYLEPPPRAIDPGQAERRVRTVGQRHARELRQLQASLESLQLERRWRTRQLDGTEVDIDELVRWRAALCAGQTPEERVYQCRRRHEREVATLILLDLSLSSDSWIDNRRILDVSRDSIIMLGEVLSRSLDHFAVAGFQSHTRHDCRWLPIKDFDEPWKRAAERMLAVEPAGYTRIGPALRHGIEVLSHHPARRRLLLLVTDGKPTDYDRYEGRYGMDDVRQCFREAEQQQVHPFAITVTDRTSAWLPRTFGKGNFEVLKRPDELPATLTQLYAELAL